MFSIRTVNFILIDWNRVLVCFETKIWNYYYRLRPAHWRKECHLLAIHVGEAISRSIEIDIGAPQGSVLSATLFKLYVHFLPIFFRNLTCHLFADDLAIVLTGLLENKFSKNIEILEKQAKRKQSLFIILLRHLTLE